MSAAASLRVQHAGRALARLLVTFWLLLRLFLVLGVMLIAFASFFLATERGYTLLLDTLLRHSDYQLNAEMRQGFLLGRQEWRGVHLQGPQIDLQLEHAVLTLEPWALLRGEVHIEQLWMQGAEMLVPPKLERGEEGNKIRGEISDLPQIHLPVDLHVSDLRVDNVQVQRGEEMIFSLNQLHGRFDYRRALLQAQFLLDWQDYVAVVDAAVLTWDDYPLKLRLAQRLKGQDWQGWAELSGSALSADLALLSQGQWQGEMTVHAETQLSPLHFELSGDWQQLAWLKAVERQTTETKNERFAHSATGHVQIQGSPQSLQLYLSDVALGGAHLPPATLNASLHYDAGKISNLDLNINTLDGEIKGRGEVALSPLSWQFSLDSSDLNASNYRKDWDFSLKHLRLLSNGKKEDNWQAQLAVFGEGVWQNDLLNLKGEAFYWDRNVLLKGVDFILAGNRLRADGVLKEDNSDVRWSLHAPNLSALTPNVRGSLQGEGILRGSRSMPLIQGNMQIKDLAWRELFSLDTASVNLDDVLNLQAGKVNNQLIINGLRYGEHAWQNISLRTSGSMRRYEAQLQSEGGAWNLAARIKGQQDDGKLQGQIEDLRVQGPEQHWLLPAVADWSYAHGDVQLKHFCLQDSFSHLCVDAAQQSQVWSLDYQLHALSPRSFKAWIPDHTVIDTEISGKGSLRKAGALLDGSAALYLRPGTVSTSSGGRHFRIPIRSGDVKAHFEQGAWQLGVDLDLERLAQVHASVNLPDGLAKNGRVRSEGELLMEHPDVLEEWFGQISDVQGRLEGRWRVAGRLDQPQLNAFLRLMNGSVTVPPLAAKFSNITLNMDVGEAGRVNISGGAQSGKGTLKLDGYYALFDKDLNLNLQGERFQVANSERMRVDISPQLQFSFGEQGVLVKGVMDIPLAYIDIPDTSSTINPSGDVVFVKNLEGKSSLTERNQTLVEMNILLRLGDEIFFNNPDAKIQLDGDLLIGLKPGQTMTGEGVIQVVQGEYKIYGQTLNVDHGRVLFSGGPLSMPSLDIRASRRLEQENVTVWADVTGTPKQTLLKLSSSPAMPDSSVLSYLLLGRAPGAGDSSFLQTAAVMGANKFSRDLVDTIGLDELQFSASGVQFGKNVSDQLYLGLRSNFFTGVSEALAEFRFNDKLILEAVGGSLEQAADILYTIETD